MTIDAVLLEHAPRGVDDPMYVPWWAKGPYAEQKRTKYTLADGTTIEAGRVLVRGTGGPRSVPEGSPVCTPQPSVQKVTERPGKARTTPSRAEGPPDPVRELLQVHRTPAARLALCAKYGVDPAIITGAPNPGVGAMRLANALRRAIG